MSTLDFNISTFERKQESLFNAHKKAQTLLAGYIELLPYWPYEWDFNLLHDLIHRLENRVFDLQSEYREWHFENFGYNAYDV